MAETETKNSPVETPNPGAWKTPTANELLDQLKLGVNGHGTPGDTERFAKARKALEDFNEKSDRAYAAAHWSREPSLTEPFGTTLLVRHGGNLSAALNDPRFQDAVTTALDLDSYEQSSLTRTAEPRRRYTPQKQRKAAKK